VKSVGENEKWRLLVLNENHTLSIRGKTWATVLRVMTIITLFLGAYTMVQSVFVWVQDFHEQNVSMLVVAIYLLVTPFSFLAALFFAFGVHRISRGDGGDMQIVLGYAMAVMAAVDNLIYVSVHHSSDSLSFYILGGIEFICFVICFLYYQGIGSWAVTLCAAILLVACTLLKTEEAVRYFISIQYYTFTGYYFSQVILDLLIAAEGLLFVISMENGIVQKK
jgi:hypothetical protein